MIKLPDAELMLLRANEVNNIEHEYDNLLKEIKLCAEKGEYQYVFTKFVVPLHRITHKRLEENKFKVNVQSYAGGKMDYTISWSEV